MSRSNPQMNAPNPAVRWFEWNGEQGLIRYYDKDAKTTVVESKFTFMLLDQLGSVRGWHDASESGIYSNEVRDTRQDVLIVKAFKGGTLAEGIYRSIKDRVNAAGGQFVTNCYIAFKHDGHLAIGSLRFKGAALNAWVEFSKAHRSELFEKAIAITGYTEGRKGRIVFRVPTFEIVSLSSETNNEALTLDRILQTWLKDYLGRTTHEQAERVPEDDGNVSPIRAPEPVDEDPIPF